MKKVFLFAIAAIASTAAFSQVKWGVQATGNLASNSVTIDGVDADILKKSANIGFGVGVSSEARLSDNLSLRSSLNLLQKGGKLKSQFNLGGGDGTGDDMFPDVEVTNKFYYAELPVNLVFNVTTTSGKLFFGAGPSVGMGLFGKSKISATNPFEPGTEAEEVDAFKKEEDGGAGYKRFDLGANAVAGYQWNSGLYVNAGYLMGLSNMIKSEDGEKMKNRGLQLTIGYFFSK